MRNALRPMATALRFISEPELRKEITAATNKVQAYNGFSAWLRFGHDAIERNDPAEQEKIIKTKLAARQLRDLPHRARHDRRPAPARRGGLDDRV